MASPSATSGAVSRVKSSASSVKSDYGYPHGHFGHLSDGEEEAFRKFKAYLQEKGDYRPGPPPSHDDPTLLRYLRARRWVVEDGYKQFKDTEDWRAANHLNLLYETIDLGAYESTRSLYPQWTGRRDKRGIPLYLFEIRKLDHKTIHAYEKAANADTYVKSLADGRISPKLLPLMALYENLTRFAQPMCTELTDRENARTPITLSTNIVDVSGVSLRQFWNLKSHMQAASTLATAHYPETLDRIFIVGAPIFFATVWGWIKRWFDPITVSKIFILSAAEVKPTLEAFIDAKNIPRQYGGQLDFKFGEKPNLDPAIRELATWDNGYNDFPEGPVYWRPIEDGKRLECIAVGRKNGKDRRERVCTIPRAFPDEPLLQLAPELIPSGPALGSNDAGKAGEPPATATGPAAAEEAEVANTARGEAAAAPSGPQAQPLVTTGVEVSSAPAVASVPQGEEATHRGNAPPQPDVQGVQNLRLVPKTEESVVSEKSLVPDPPQATETTLA